MSSNLVHMTSTGRRWNTLFWENRRLDFGREIHLNSAKSRSEQQNISHRKLFRKPKSNLKGMYLQPSDILRRLYCTSRPSWWNRHCPRRTNERPLKRDKEREGNTIDFCYWKISEERKISEGKRSFGWETISFVSRTIFLWACKFYFFDPDRDILEVIRFILYFCSDRSLITVFSRRTIEELYRLRSSFISRLKFYV